MKLQPFVLVYTFESVVKELTCVQFRILDQSVSYRTGEKMGLQNKTEDNFCLFCFQYWANS